VTKTLNIFCSVHKPPSPPLLAISIRAEFAAAAAFLAACAAYVALFNFFPKSFSSFARETS
jgi:hypothetical protein